jgi:hypothetical protein
MWWPTIEELIIVRLYGSGSLFWFAMVLLAAYLAFVLAQALRRGGSAGRGAVVASAPAPRRRAVVLTLVLALVAAGCGGGDAEDAREPITGYENKARPAPDVETTAASGYVNPDGSPPVCTTLYSSGRKVCNTDESVVRMSELMLDGYTLEDVFEYVTNECVRAGNDMSTCSQDASRVSQLVLRNRLHGLPQLGGR